MCLYRREVEAEGNNEIKMNEKGGGKESSIECNPLEPVTNRV